MSSSKYLYKNENMDNSINSKSSPIQMREFMKRIREGKFEATQTTPKKDLSMHDMLKLTRNINEEIMVDDEKGIDKVPDSKKTVYDQKTEEEKLISYFKDGDLDVSAKFAPLEVYDNWVFWGGDIDGIITFIYSVTQDELTSVYELEYLPDFSPDSPKNALIAELLKTYYDSFKEFWRDNMLQK